MQPGGLLAVCQRPLLCLSETEGSPQEPSMELPERGVYLCWRYGRPYMRMVDSRGRDIYMIRVFRQDDQEALADMCERFLNRHDPIVS